MTLLKTTYTAIALLWLGTQAAWAVDPVQQNNSTALWFENWVGLSNATLVVAEPGGKVTQLFVERGTPVYELDRAEARDGVYTYELRAATEETVAKVNSFDNGRGSIERDTAAKPFYMSGSFTVSRGIIIRPEEIKEEDG